MSLPLREDPYYQNTPDRDYVALTYNALDEIHEINRVRDASAGAICSFIGTTRDNFQGKQVVELEYETYPAMALKTMAKIVSEARQLSLDGSFSFEWPNYPSTTATPSPKPPTGLIPQTHSTPSPRDAVRLTRISLTHRLGVVPPRESSISIVVSSAHRKEAFRACEWILEEVKKRVEVWKREVYDGENGKAWKENFPVK